MKTSKVTGKEYNENEVVYILNQTQFLAYMLNSEEEILVDIIPDVEKGKLIYVMAKNDVTRNLYYRWNRHQLPY